MTDDRQAAFAAGFTLARALGDYEATQALIAAGWQDGQTLVPLNLGGLEAHLPAEGVVLAAFELASVPKDQRDTVTAAWRSTAEVYADPELYAALTRDAGVEPGGRTIAIYIPADVPDEIADWLETTIADTVHDLDDGKPWDLHVVGQAGDPLNIWTEPDAEPFADTDLNAPDAHTTVLSAVDYQRVVEHLDAEDEQYRKAMRTERGRAED